MYFNYCKGLRFQEQPDYMYLRQLFRILFRTLNHIFDYVFDWTVIKSTHQNAKFKCPIDGVITEQDDIDKNKKK